jgi:hypothetical protein
VHIIELQAENFKRLKAVRITADGKNIVLAGENKQGKSSVLDVIIAGVLGKKFFPAVPIHGGQSQAKLHLDLGDYVIDRVIRQGTDTLRVVGKDGVPIKSPQTLIDGLISKVAFDPLSFVDMDNTKRAETLRQLVPELDVTEIDAQYAKLYTQRTLVNRDAESAEARFKGHTVPKDVLPFPEAPESEVSITVLATELAAIKDKLAENAKVRSELTSAKERLGQADEAVGDRKARVLELETQLVAARAALESAETNREIAQNLVDTATKKTEKLRDPDPAPVQVRLQAADKTNAEVRENVQAKRDRDGAVLVAKNLEAEWQGKVKASKDLTSQLDKLTTERMRRISKAPMPIEGLSIDTSGLVTLNGYPFDQASQAEQVAASAAIGCARNPQLKVLIIPNASVCRPNIRDAIFKVAAERDYQVWMEIADPSAPGAVLIEDGEVKATAAE